ncbi:MAG: putative Transcriptional regulator, MerR family [Nocardia sp.]|nr:putative Transcriptional regulator, MerR family [Nocardia sp.]
METEYTIDELARAGETTVRSVRVYHERGLLPSPELRGRVGYYRTDHLTRLHTISRLLNRGMKLNGIRELFDAWDRGDGLADVLGVTGNGIADARDATMDAPADSPPARIEASTLDGGDLLDEYRLTNPRCYHLATHLIGAGLSVPAAEQLVEQLRTDCERIAERYASQLFRGPADQGRESTHSPQDQASLESDRAIALLLVTAAVSDLLDQAFTRFAVMPVPEPAD